MGRSRTRSEASRRAIAHRVNRGEFGLRRIRGLAAKATFLHDRESAYPYGRRLVDVHEVDPDCEPTADMPENFGGGVGRLVLR